MQATFQHGEPLMVDYTPAGAVSAGDVVVIGGVPFIAHIDIEAARKGAVAIGGGVYKLTADGAISPGSDVFWDDSANKVTQTVGTNKHFGKLLGITPDVGGSGPASDGDIAYVFHCPEYRNAVDDLSGPQVITDNSAQALAVGPNGATNPTFDVDASVSSAITGVKIVGRATGAGVTLATLGGTNEDLLIAPKGSGAVKITSTGAAGLAVGPNGSTNPVFQVDCSVSSEATGIKVTGAAAASGVAIAAISSGTNEALTLDAKGSGAITIGGTSTGNITLGNGVLFSGKVSPTGFAASSDNLAIGNVFHVRITTDGNGNENLTGMTGGVDGRVVMISNIGTVDSVVIKHDATSTAANRFYGPNSADVTLRKNGSVYAIYDGTVSRWRVMGA